MTPRAGKGITALLGVAAVGGLAGGLSAPRGDGFAEVLAAPAASRAYVTMRIEQTSRLELADTGRLPIRLKPRRGGSVTVTARLDAGAQQTVKLTRLRRTTLTRGRWKTVTLPITSAGRAALGGCPAGRIAVTVTERRSRTRRVTSAPLRLEAPACARFFGPRAVWNTELRPDAPLDPESGAVMEDLLSKVSAASRSQMPPTINTEAYSPPVYTVPATQPRVRVRLDRDAVDPALVSAFASVPLPDDAAPAPGTDGELVVWQPSTNTMWEFWRLRRGERGWLATWGGRLDDVSSGPGHFAEPQADWGTSASSLALAGGLITPRELREGRIDHALALAVPYTRAGVFSLPAQRTDGESPCPQAVPEGARLRLDPNLDIDALGLPPAVAALARAAQRYGIIVRDQADTLAFYAQSAVSLGTNPYPELFGGQAPYELLRSFPWSHLQLLRMDLRQERGAKPPLAGSELLPGC